jgi:hypothetical protein
MLLIMFINAFSLYCNMYKSLIKVYFTLVSQTFQIHMHCANVFILTFGLHRASIDKVLLFILDLLKLDRGMVLTVNSEEKVILAFLLFFAKDMP